MIPSLPDHRSVLLSSLTFQLLYLTLISSFLCFEFMHSSPVSIFVTITLNSLSVRLCSSKFFLVWSIGICDLGKNTYLSQSWRRGLCLESWEVPGHTMLASPSQDGLSWCVCARGQGSLRWHASLSALSHVLSTSHPREKSNNFPTAWEMLWT